MKKETAIEWLIEELIKYKLKPDEIYPDNVLFQKAKIMEKQQIIDAIKFFKERPYNEETPEQYYNETYGQNRD
jgi:hypothetical protein